MADDTSTITDPSIGGTDPLPTPGANIRLAQTDMTSQASPASSQTDLSQPGYDINQVLSSELSSLQSSMPGYTPPDTSAQEAQIAKYRMSAEEAEEKAQGITMKRSAYEDQIAKDLHEEEAKYDHLFQQYPSRQVYYGASLQAAPLVSMLAVLGGKAAGVSGKAMLSALNGMMEGLNTGSEENFQHHLQAWQAAVQQYKERHDRQLEIYNMMLNAYKDRADAAFKARDFALEMTKDSMDERDKMVKNSIDIFKARVEAVSSIDKLTALFGTKARRDAYDQLPPVAYEYFQRDAVAGTVPAAAKSGAARYQYYTKMAQEHPNPDQYDNVQAARDAQMSPLARRFSAALAANHLTIPGVYSQSGRTRILEQQAHDHPDWTEDDIVKLYRGGAAATQQAQIASRVVTQQESKVVASAMDLFSGPNSFANRLEAAAQKVDFGSATFANKVRLWMQGNVWSGDDMAVYLSQLTDFRSKMTTLLQNGGLSTEGAQHRVQELMPTPTSMSALRKIIENSRAVAMQLEGQNAQILQALRSGAPIDQIVNLAKVPMQKPGQPKLGPPVQQLPPPSAPGAPGAARPPPATAPGPGAPAPQAAPPPQAQAPGQRQPRTIQAGAVKEIDGVRYRSDGNGNWYTIQ